MAELEIITECFVPGVPRTKGSLDLVPRTRPCKCSPRCRGVMLAGTYVRESVTDSKPWRALMAGAVRADIAMRNRIGPTDQPVGVRALFVLPALPELDLAELARVAIAPGSGDVDKLTRNLLDALTDAGAYGDDRQVAKLIIDKVALGSTGPWPGMPGVLLQCWVLPVWAARMAIIEARRQM